MKFAERVGQLRVIEGELPRSLDGIDGDELALAVGQIDAIPEASPSLLQCGATVVRNTLFCVRWKSRSERS